MVALMPPFDDDLVRSRILGMLTQSQYRQLKPHFEHVELKSGEVLYAPGDIVKYVYFPDDAVVSLLFHGEGNRTLEVAMDGNEGAVGFAIHLGGVRSYNLCVVRDSGTATRIELAVFIRFVNSSDLLHGLLDKYVHALLGQIAQLSVCNRFHSIDERFARWLLMTHDRIGSDKFLATQESIAHMLGVRRSGVTTTAGSFHKRNMIEYSRGHMEILDRSRLSATACPCHQIIKKQYDSFLS